MLNNKEKREINRIFKILYNTKMDELNYNKNQLLIFKKIVNNIFELRDSYPLLEKKKFNKFLISFNKIWKFLDKVDIVNRNDSLLYKILKFRNSSYELFTIELIKLISKLLKDSEIIVEMGAGNGTLSYLLRKFNKKKNIVATDIPPNNKQSWNIKTDYPVYIMKNIDEIVKKYNPDTIIISWMPKGLNLVKDIKKYKSIKNIILIGAIDATGTKKMYNDKNIKEIKNDFQVCISDDHLITGFDKDRSLSQLFIITR